MRPLPAVVSTADLPLYGITAAHARTYLRRGLWSRLGPGVLLTRAGEPSRTDRLRLGLVAGGPSAAISGVDAVRLAGVEAAATVGLPALVLTKDIDRRRVSGVLLRYTTRDYRTWRTPGAHPVLPGESVAAISRALADASALGAPRYAMRAWTTEAVQRGLCSADELADELRAANRRGSKAFRLAIEDVLDGAASIAEARAVDYLRLTDVPAFELNVPVLLHGRLVAVLDIFWRALRAVVEIESRRHHGLGQDFDRTYDRHNRLTGFGLAVRHDPPKRLGATWAADVEAWLRSRARELGVPYRPSPVVLRGGRDGPTPFLVTS